MKLLSMLDTTWKKVTVIVISVALVLAGSIGVYAWIVEANTKKPEELLSVVKDVFIEYGESLPEELQTFLDVKELTDEEKKDVLKKTKIKYIDLETVEEAEYPKLGEYVVEITYETATKKSKLLVQDTTPPVFNEVEEISIEQDTEEYNFEEEIQATDLQEVTYEFNIEEVDMSVPGEYIMKVIAKDASGNEATKDIKIIITEKPEEIIEEPVVEEVVVAQQPTARTKVELSVPYINQYSYGAPMGCEGASLLQAVQGKGYGTWDNLKGLLDNMPYTDSGNPHNGYVSSPYIIDDFYVFQSIFAGPLASYGTSRYGISCANTSGYSPAQLVDELYNGNTSVVYVTYKFATPKWDNFAFGSCVGNMHVMTLIGYNPANNQYKVMDPAGEGAYWVSGAKFEAAYNALRWAVTIR